MSDTWFSILVAVGIPVLVYLVFKVVVILVMIDQDKPSC